MTSISTTEFAAHLETDTRTARKFLRSITPKDEQPGKGARWAIAGNKRSLNTMKKNFDQWSAAQAEAKAAKVEEVTEEPTPEQLVEITNELLDELDN